MIHLLYRLIPVFEVPLQAIPRGTPGRRHVNRRFKSVHEEVPRVRVLVPGTIMLVARAGIPYHQREESRTWSYFSVKVSDFDPTPVE